MPAFARLSGSRARSSGAVSMSPVWSFRSSSPQPHPVSHRPRLSPDLTIPFEIVERVPREVRARWGDRSRPARDTILFVSTKGRASAIENYNRKFVIYREEFIQGREHTPWCRCTPSRVRASWTCRDNHRRSAAANGAVSPHFRRVRSMSRSDGMSNRVRAGRAGRCRAHLSRRRLK